MIQKEMIIYSKIPKNSLPDSNTINQPTLIITSLSPLIATIKALLTLNRIWNGLTINRVLIKTSATITSKKQLVPKEKKVE